MYICADCNRAKARRWRLENREYVRVTNPGRMAAYRARKREAT